MKEIALHILDIAENSVAAGAKTVEITVEENWPDNKIRVSIKDDGSGLDERKLAHIADPFVTSRTTRVAGLGIPFLKAAAEECNGSLCVTSKPGEGTCLEVDFQRDHIDRMPLGDLASTVLTLVIGSPHIRWLFHYRVDGRAFVFDDEPIKRELGDIPLTDPLVLSFIRETLQEGVRHVQQAANEAQPREM